MNSFMSLFLKRFSFIKKTLIFVKIHNVKTLKSPFKYGSFIIQAYLTLQSK